MADTSKPTALITGASRGIGAATARHLASQGMTVILAARSDRLIRDLADEINKTDGTAFAVACDVADMTSVQAAVDVATEHAGRLDLLVNNAGVIEPIARIAESDPHEWGRAVDVNLKGVYHGLRAALPIMARQGHGVIVNISSGAATSALEGWSHYCATKAAVLMLTRSADLEYRDAGVQVVGLSPGTVATGMQVAIKASGINPVSRLDPGVHIPATDVARAIDWLYRAGAREFAGGDFSLKSEEGRRRAGL